MTRNLRFVLRQVVFTNKAFWRNPASAFFTFAFPLMFLVIFTTIFGNSTTDIQLPTGVLTVKTSTFYVAAMAAFSVITACYTNIAISVTFSRDTGILKRTRGTPMPGWAYVLARMIHAVIVAIILVVVCTAFGALFYGASVPGRTLPAFILTVVVGAATFASLGLALVSAIPNADASPAVVNATILPILFLSDIFIPFPDPPPWVAFIQKVFPVGRFAKAMQGSFFAPTGNGFEWMNLAVVFAWGVLGLLLAARFFTWEPRR
jgi:ABC-2 type transport system permease protein